MMLRPPMAEPNARDDAAGSTPVTNARITALWAPLAASWLLMGLEMPLFAAVVARLPDETVQLAAFGSVVFPFSLLVEAPIIMLLAASTALAGDRGTYVRLMRFVHLAGFTLTGLHVLVAFTPVFDLVARELVRAPEDVIEPARLGLRIMTPWTWAIAYRRFQQGVLIRFEHARAVVIGTGVRLVANVAVLSTGLAIGGLPGIVVGTAGIACGVVAEAAFAGFCVRRYCRAELDAAPPPLEPFTWARFARFYVPLACTPLMTLLVQPMGAAAMNRMPNALSSVAAWPAVYGLIFMTRSAGFAFNEVVVTLVQRPGGLVALRRFGRLLAAATVTILALLAITPAGAFWFGTVSALPPELAAFSAAALGFGVLMPGYAVLQSLYQGALVRSRRTRGVTEAVAIYLVISAVLLWSAVTLEMGPGIQVALGAFTIAGLAQTGWLWWRSRGGRVATTA